MSTSAKELNSTEIHQLLDHITSLPDKSGVIRPLFIWGKAGVGKTEMVRDYAASRGMEFAYCAIAQLEEPGDLLGMPTISNNETIYCKPSWLPDSHENGKPGILLLDDFNRANSLVLAAAMQLAQMHTLMSYSLPNNWTIVCTGNPDGSDYSTSELDIAMRTRFIHVRARFDKMAWAKWAIDHGLQSEAINFVLTHPEQLDRGKLTNSRTLTSFFRLIAGLTPAADHPGLIETIGLGLLDEETVASYFRFMKEANMLIPAPEKILFHADTNGLEAEMTNLLVHKDGVRLDLFSTMFNRLMLYCSKPVEGRINTENLVRLFTLKDIPNDYRTHMYIEFGNLKQPELEGIRSDKRVADAILKAS